MARVRGILDRLRPVGAPGGVARVGVPADPRDSLRRELAPVFACLEPVLRECARVRQEAEAAARQRREEAVGRADDILAKARAKGEAERTRAAASARVEAMSEAERSLAAGRERAAQVRRRGEQRRPQLLARVLELVRADLRAIPATTGERDRLALTDDAGPGAGS